MRYMHLLVCTGMYIPHANLALIYEQSSFDEQFDVRTIKKQQTKQKIQTKKYFFILSQFYDHIYYEYHRLVFFVSIPPCCPILFCWVDMLY